MDVALPVLVMYVVLATTTYITNALLGPFTLPNPPYSTPVDSRLATDLFHSQSQRESGGGGGREDLRGLFRGADLSGSAGGAGWEERVRHSFRAAAGNRNGHGGDETTARLRSRGTIDSSKRVRATVKK